MSNFFTSETLSVSGESVFLGNKVLGAYALIGGDNILMNDSANSVSLVQDVSINTLCVNSDASFGNLSVVGDVSFNGNLSVDGVFINKLYVVNDASFNSHLSVDGDVSLNNKLYVVGDVSLNSHLSVEDASFNKLYVAGELNANGGIKCNTDGFTVSSGGNTVIAGTLLTGTTTSITGILNANGGITVNTDKFTVASDTGGTVIDGTLEVTGTSTLRNTKTTNLFVSDDLSCNRLDVISDASFNKAYIQDLTVEGTFKVNDILYNNISIENTVLLSTSIDISNQGTGPALKVSQYGNYGVNEGDEAPVALFDAGSEGPALLIDNTGKSTFYMDVSCNKNVKIDGTLDVSGVTTLIDASINNLIVEEISCNRLDISGPISLTSSTKLNLFGTKGAGPPNDTVTSINIGSGFIGGVVGPDGLIYCIPYNTSDGYMVSVDPITETVVETIDVGNGFGGGVLGPDGRIYCIPHDAVIMKVVDPSTSPSTITNGNIGLSRQMGGVLGPNGFIYCIPYHATHMKAVDTKNPSGGYLWIETGYNLAGGVLGPDGCIYCMPYNTSVMKVVDPNDNNSITSITVSTGLMGGVVGPNGNIYCMPYNAGIGIKVVDISLKSVVATIGNIGGGYVGGVLGLDGLIYCIPYSTSLGYVQVVDPTTNTVVQTINTGNGFKGGVLGPDGRIYCIPYDDVDMKVIDTGTPIPLNVPWMMEAYYNKF